MSTRRLVVLFVALASTPAFAGEDFKLPKEVTPAIRAACERDVRRLCIGEDPTVEKVKACVFQRFMQLGRRCQFELASAGLVR